MHVRSFEVVHTPCQSADLLQEEDAGLFGLCHVGLLLLQIITGQVAQHGQRNRMSASSLCCAKLLTHVVPIYS